MPPKDLRPEDAFQAGDTRYVDGVMQIHSGTHWVKYPSVLSRLVRDAIDAGWSIDDGLPVRFHADGMPYIRVTTYREPGYGYIGDDTKASSGYLFHVVCNMSPGLRQWTEPIIHMKTFTSKPDTEEWVKVESVKKIRGTIASNRIRPESKSVYAQANH